MFRCARLVLPLAVVTCGDDFERNLKEADMYPLLSTGGTTDATSPTTTGPSTDPPTSTTGGPGDATTLDETTTGTSAGDATTIDGGASSTGGEALPPQVLAVDMPAKVSVAGPVQFTAMTEHTSIARATLDGVDLGLLADEGGGVFSGVVPIYGSVDMGAHVLEVVAENGDLSHAYPVQFDVSTPGPGTPAWTLPGPTGSRTRRIAVTAEGDVIEVGTREIGGVARPAVRKRSGVTGAELWPEGTIVLDDHEGEAVDVAVAPDGRLWVAMNVREALNKWRPRIVLLDADGHTTGLEVPTGAGSTVRAVDNDGTGGCLAVGFTSTGYGDTDFVIWRVTGEGVPVLGGKTWDYRPVADDPAHTFTDIASVVVVQDGVAWIAGFSHGKHNELNKELSRGLIVGMDIDTGTAVGPAIVAPASGQWTQSGLYGAAAHPDGLLVTGFGCNDACDVQRVETALYGPAGARVWFRPELPATIAYGSAVARTAHGGVVVAATMREGSVLRGRILGRLVYAEGETFDAPFPASKESSEAAGAAVGPYDRLYAGGYRTFGGVPDAWLVHLHP
jgi:hypothetical protein